MPSSASNRVRRFWADRRGTTSIEFAAVGLMYVSLLLGGIDLGRYFLTVHSLNTAVAAAARAGLANTYLSGCSAPARQVQAQVPFLQPASLSLCVTQDTASPIQQVSVTGTYPFTFALPVLGSSIMITVTDSISY